MLKTASSGEDVIVESHGKPSAVLISPEEYEKLREGRANRKRQETLDWLRDFEQRQNERNKDLTPEEAVELAVRAGRDINATVAKRHHKRTGYDR